MSYERTAEHRQLMSEQLTGRAFSAEHLHNLSESHKQTHCDRGHELTPGNAYVRSSGRKSCRQCHKSSGMKRHLKRTYGLSLEAWQELRTQQNNSCLSCGQPFDDSQRKLKPVVDHDHSCCSGDKSCGKCIRGLLHSKCNVALGLFNDSPALLRKAAGYLEAFHA